MFSMRRTAAVLGLAMLLHLLGPMDARAQSVAVSASKSSRATEAAAQPALRPVVQGVGRGRLFSGGRVREQSLGPTAPRARRFFIQGGLYGCCEGEGAGFVFGAGAISSPLGGVRILGDGHVLGEPGYGSALYGSGTLAYQLGDDTGGHLLLGGGVGVLYDGYGPEAGHQFVVGFGGKIGFGQIRVVRLRDYTFGLLLGGVRF